MDASRLARAVHLTVTDDGPGRWIVAGGAMPHVVTFDAEGRLACDCADATMHGGAECKHCLRVRLATVDAEVLATLGALVPMPTRHRRKAKAA